MSDAIHPVQQHSENAVALAPELVASARAYAAAATSDRTRRSYAGAWRTFTAWCEARGLCPLPASATTVALFLSARADEGRKAATLALDLAAISQAHKVVGHASPRGTAEVQAVLKGIRRARGTAQTKKAPVLVPELRAMVGGLPSGILGTRDRALLLLGFAGAFRRSELVELNAGDVRFTDDGLEVTLRRSKTDQEGEGAKVGVPFGSDPSTCPVRSLRRWLEAADLGQGPLFRSVNRHGRVGGSLTAHAVALIVKRAAERAGLDPASYSGHSLRAGLATAAAKAGKPERVIAKQTRHKSIAVLRGYIRDAELFSENAASGIGL